MSSQILLNPVLLSEYINEYLCTNGRYYSMPPQQSIRGLSQLDADSEAAGCMDTSQPVDRYLNENLHLVWFGHFAKRFAYFSWCTQYNHIWTLEPCDDLPANDNRIMKESAKVRFICEECGKSWTSMQGTSSFLVQQYGNHFVLNFRLYGQMCSDCQSGQYQHAIWYPEEVIKVLDNVYARVARKFYGITFSQNRRTGTRVGKPLGSHDVEKCQACAAGHCTVGNRPRHGNRGRGGMRRQGGGQEAAVAAEPVGENEEEEVEEPLPREHFISTSSEDTGSGCGSSRMSPAPSSALEDTTRIEELVPPPEVLSRN